MSVIKNNKTIFLIIALIIALIYCYFAYTNTYSDTVLGNDKTTKETIYVKGDTITETETKIVYVPKEVIVTQYIDSKTGEIVSSESKEKTDAEININKTDFNIKVNGHEQTFTKNDDEKYVFEDGKIVLEQSSAVSMDLTIKPIEIDKTKHYGLGIGINDDKDVSGIITVPTKNEYVDAWIYADKNSKSVGVMVRF